MANKPALGNPLPAPSQSRRVVTNLNLKRRGAPGSNYVFSGAGEIEVFKNYVNVDEPFSRYLVLHP